METDLLPCPFCGGRDINIGPAPGLPSRFRVICNTCRTNNIDDRKAKVHAHWTMRNILAIGSHLIYLSPGYLADDTLYLPFSSSYKAFDNVARELATFVPPPDDDSEAWDKAYQKMEDIMEAMKQLQKIIRERKRAFKKTSKKRSQT